MPRTVKAFLLLSLLYGVWLVWWAVAPLALPSPHRLQFLAALPAETRAMVVRADWMAAAIGVAIPFVVVAILAIAALARQNWARWVLALLLIAGEFSFFLVIADYAYLHPEIAVGPDFTWTGGWQKSCRTRPARARGSLRSSCPASR